MNKAKKIYSTLNQKWNYTRKDIDSILGLNKGIFQQARGSRIVVYHGVCRSDHTRFNSIFVRTRIFEKHLQFYKKYFHVISLDDYYRGHFSQDRFNICITFDDGFANNYKYVLPLMNKFQVPITFFITGIRDAGYDILWNDFLVLAQKYGPKKFKFDGEEFFKNKYGFYASMSRGRTLKDLSREDCFERKAEIIKSLQPMIPAKIMDREQEYWTQMTEREIRFLSRSRFTTIGSHGHYHNDLSKIPIVRARDEIVRSKHFLEDILQKEVRAIAFPYGSYSRDVLAESKSAGFSQLLATDFLFPEDYSDLTMRERFIVNPYISVNNQMLSTINGRYC